jgi:hypothetical protein
MGILSISDYCRLLQNSLWRPYLLLSIVLTLAKEITDPVSSGGQNLINAPAWRIIRWLIMRNKKPPITGVLFSCRTLRLSGLLSKKAEEACGIFTPDQHMDGCKAQRHQPVDFKGTANGFHVVVEDERTHGR